MQVPDQVPKDLGGMLSTGISAFAYPKLVKALGLPDRLPKVHDSFQMLALPELDVLDALDCDVVTINENVTNAFEQPELWKPYDYAGRLPALVLYPESFEESDDGSVVCGGGRMVKDSYVFDVEHGGQPVDLSADIPKPDLDEVRETLEKHAPTDEAIRNLVELCRKVRESTDRAVFVSCPLTTMLSIGAVAGIGVFPVLCLLDPDYVRQYHEIMVNEALNRVHRILPSIAPYVDVVMLGADDWGTQNATIASPDTFRELFQPYIRRVTDECHRLAPDVKLFLHSCGALYDIIESVADAGFDILNPVQWPAGGHSYREWKDRARGRIALWGGGVNAQATLPLGTVDDVRAEVREVVSCLKGDGGYIFCNIHNLLAEIPPEKIIAMYEEAARA